MTAAREVQAAKMRQAWRDGKFAARRKPMHRRAWTPEQNRVLASLAGSRPVEEIADALERRFFIRRTTASLRIQAKRLGLSLWAGCYSMRDMERIFGTPHQTIARHWIADGHLDARRWNGRGSSEGWWFEPSEVERFVRECGWLYPVERMQAGHRLVGLAQMAQRTDPWIVGLDALCPLFGISRTNLKRWVDRGLVPHQRRPGAGGLGEVCVRGRDIPAIREAIAAARRHAHDVTTERFTSAARSRAAATAALTVAHRHRLTGRCRNGHERTIQTTLITRSGKLQCRSCRAEWQARTQPARRAS